VQLLLFSKFFIWVYYWLMPAKNLR
jgi:hypothetical protein